MVDIDQVALDAARQLTAANDVQARATMQCAIVAALQRALAANPEPEAVRLRDELRERTPVDYAIEHAGYLVTAANQVIEARNELDALMMRQDEGGDVGDDEMQAAQEAVGDASHVLRLAIHEFEKRRDRALAATGKQQVREVQGLDVEQLKNLVSSVHRTVSLGHQKGPHAYSGENFGRYLAEAARDCRQIMGLLDALATRQPERIAEMAEVRQTAGQEQSHWGWLIAGVPFPGAGCCDKSAVPLYAGFPPAQAVDLGPVRSALQAAEALCVCCASVDGYSRSELNAFGQNMCSQFRDALALIDGQAVGNG